MGNLSSLRRRRLRFVLMITGLLSVCVGVGIAGAVVLGQKPAPGQPIGARESASLRASFIQRLEELNQSAEYAPAPDSPFEMLRAVANGVQWQMATYRNAAGKWCELHVVPGEGKGYGCSRLGTEKLIASWGSRQLPDTRNTAYEWDEAWVSGIAQAPITRVEILLTDCSALGLPMTMSGGFFGVIDASIMHSGVLPHSVRGLSASGRVVATDLAEFPPATGAHGNIGQPDVPAKEHECD
jgi:hypothetical protein